MKVGDLVYHVDDKEDGKIWPGVILYACRKKRGYKVFFTGPGSLSREWRTPQELGALDESR